MKDTRIPLKFYAISLLVHVGLILFFVLLFAFMTGKKPKSDKWVTVNISVSDSTAATKKSQKPRFKLPDFQDPEWFNKTDHLLKNYMDSTNYHDLLRDIYQRYRSLPKTLQQKVLQDVARKHHKQSETLKRSAPPGPGIPQILEEWERRKKTLLYRYIPPPAQSTNDSLLRQMLEDPEKKTEEYIHRMEALEQHFHKRDALVHKFFRLHDLFKVLTNSNPPQFRNFPGR